MCTLTLAWQVFDDAPVAVAANRDEAVGRESLPPGVYREEPLIVAPSDAEAGGTWIGYNEHGVFAGLTNKWTEADLAGERSRGLLVADVLEAESAAEAGALIERETDEREYQGFYLVVADESDAFCYYWDGRLERIEFEPGVHVVVNVAADETVDVPGFRAEAGRRQAANARAVREALAVGGGDTDGGTDDGDGIGESVDEWLERAGDVLGDHEYGVCVHGDGFGTRSSSLIALGPAGPRYEFAPGPPCETPYEAVTLEGDAASVPDGIGDGDADADVEGHI